MGIHQGNIQEISKQLCKTFHHCHYLVHKQHCNATDIFICLQCSPLTFPAVQLVFCLLAVYLKFEIQALSTVLPCAKYKILWMIKCAMNTFVIKVKFHWCLVLSVAVPILFYSFCYVWSWVKRWVVLVSVCHAFSQCIP